MIITESYFLGVRQRVVEQVTRSTCRVTRSLIHRGPIALLYSD